MINVQIVLYHSISSAAEPREGYRDFVTGRFSEILYEMLFLII